MDNESDPDFCAYAAIELTAGIADMKIAQTDGISYQLLERLRKRPPEALMREPGDDVEAVCNSIHVLLSGFCQAACDYGAAPPLLLINGLDEWRAMLAQIASELGMELFTPDLQHCADMTATAARMRLDGATDRYAFILPFCAQTHFMTCDGLISRTLPMGVDTGCFDYLMRSDELERARRKGNVDICELIRDCAKTCARNLPVPEPGAYSLVVCMDHETAELTEGEYNPKQLNRIIAELARSLRAQGAEPGYKAGSEPYRIAGMRRTLNGLLIANEMRAHMGFNSVRVVNVKALDAVLDVMARGGQIERTGVDAALAVRSIDYYARTRGIDTAQSDRLRVASGMLSKVLAKAFSDNEQADVAEIVELIPALIECFAGDGIMRPRDVARLPGLGTVRRSQLLAICGACLETENGEVYARLTPDASITKERDEEALFSADLVEADEFASVDEDDDDSDTDTIIRAEMEQESGESAEIDADTPDENAGDYEAGVETNDSDEHEPDMQYSEDDIAIAPSASNDDLTKPIEADDEVRPYYALRLQGMVNNGIREYAEMYGGDESADEPTELERTQVASPHTERDTVGPALMRSRELPLQLRIAAILMLARSLSVGGAGRLSQISAKLNERGLVVRAAARENATLESLEFRYRAELMKHVFGIKVRLKLDKHNKPSKQRRQSTAKHNTEHRASKGSI